MKTAFIGGGNMAEAILEGCLAQDFKSSEYYLIEINNERRLFMEKKWGIPTARSITSEIENYEVILLAVKPQHMQEVTGNLRSYLNQKPLIISIAAGIRLSSLSHWLSGYSRLIRAMPNIAALVHLGITGLTATSHVNQSDCLLAEKLLQAIGDILWVENEAQIDAVTAVSGSGPAYVFYFIEALEKAAESLGLTPEQSRKLALKTFEGASHLAITSSDSPNNLRQKVTSKGGTTEAALHYLEKMSVQQSFIEAVQVAEKKSKELGIPSI